MKNVLIGIGVVAVLAWLFKLFVIPQMGCVIC